MGLSKWEGERHDGGVFRRGFIKQIAAAGIGAYSLGSVGGFGVLAGSAERAMADPQALLGVSAGAGVEGLTVEPLTFTTQIGRHPTAIYYTPAGQHPKTAVLIMHPRDDQRTHFILEPLAHKGFGALGMCPPNAGCSQIHEKLVLDVAAGVQFLKSRGVEHVILAGHSGGGSLMAFYAAQAETEPPNRISETPAGDPPNLNNYTLPKVAGLTTLNAAEGEGLKIEQHLDPSVTDEADPFSYDPSLDMYNPANGFRIPPEESRYSSDFLKRYRNAQHERAERLVRIARGYVQGQNYFRDQEKMPWFKSASLMERLSIERRAEYEPYMVIFRTRADPRYYDLSLDPSDRTFGHYEAAGYKVGGYERTDLEDWTLEDRLHCVSARAFLSTESIVSNAQLYPDLRKIHIPVLQINSSADPGIFPSEANGEWESIVSTDKQKVWIIGGDHGFLPAGPKAGNGDQRQQCVDAIARWADKRWPPA